MMNYKPFIFLTLLAGLLSACSEDNGDLHHYIHKVKQRKLRVIEPFPAFTSLPGFRFPENENRRNPFKASNHEKIVDSFAPDQQRQKQPLEVFSLDALRFVGTFTQDQEMWGLIRQPDSQIMRVHLGDYMGQNYGRIVSIKNDSIKLNETIKGTSGAWQKHLTTLKLYVGKE